MLSVLQVPQSQVQRHARTTYASKRIRIEKYMCKYISNARYNRDPSNIGQLNY